MYDDGRVGAGAVEFGVQVHGGRDVPFALDDLAVGIETQDVGGPHLLPPQTPGVAPHTAVVGRHGDVARQVLAPPLPGQDAQRARELLANRELTAEAGSGAGQAHDHDGIRETLRP